jgi:hypothetical protein
MTNIPCCGRAIGAKSFTLISIEQIQCRPLVSDTWHVASVRPTEQRAGDLRASVDETDAGSERHVQQRQWLVKPYPLYPVVHSSGARPERALVIAAAGRIKTC